MGWNIKKTIKNIVKQPGKELANVGKNAVGAIGAGPIAYQLGAIGKQIIGDKPNAPSAGEDPTVSALRNRLFGEATDFEKNLGGYEKAASNQIEREGNQALKSGIKNTRQNYNSRGLLYSGLREGGEQSVRGSVASAMAGQKAQSNADLNKMAQAKYQTAAQAGLQSYQQAVQREAEIEGVKLQNQVARAQVYQQLGQGAGYAAGAYFGGRGTQSNGLNYDGSISTTPSAYNSGQYRDVNGLNIGPFSNGAIT